MLFKVHRKQTRINFKMHGDIGKMEGTTSSAVRSVI